MQALSGRARSWSASDVANPEHLREQLEAAGISSVGAIIGPAFIGYGTASSLDLNEARLARPLSAITNIEELRAACPPMEWDHGGSDPTSVSTFGVVGAANEVLSLAGYEVWNASIAHIAIVTHPGHRGRNFGRAAVALAAQHALAAGLVPQYRTLRANTASMKIAERLGFAEYGFSVYVRLPAS